MSTYQDQESSSLLPTPPCFLPRVLRRRDRERSILAGVIHRRDITIIIRFHYHFHLPGLLVRLSGLWSR